MENLAEKLMRTLANYTYKALKVMFFAMEIKDPLTLECFSQN